MRMIPRARSPPTSNAVGYHDGEPDPGDLRRKDICHLLMRSPEGPGWGGVGELGRAVRWERAQYGLVTWSQLPQLTTHPVAPELKQEEGSVGPLEFLPWIQGRKYFPEASAACPVLSLGQHWSRGHAKLVAVEGVELL